MNSEKLGSYAVIGLPNHQNQFGLPGQRKTNFPIIIFAENFSCGFSQEHAPIALEADGVRANVMVLYYACTFFGNCSATGELYPWESVDQLCKELETAQKITIDVEQNQLNDYTLDKVYDLTLKGEMGSVIDAGGIFEWAGIVG